jgi:nucleoside-diphosphate-sugar epimerase
MVLARPAARVAVTGATGYLGRALCAALSVQGIGCVPLARSNVGDLALAEPHVLATLLAGCDAVVHLAGRAHVASDDAAARARLALDNVEAPRRVATAAVLARVPRFLLASSVKVNGEGTRPGRPFRTTDAPAPVGAYAHSKLAAEARVREAVAGSTTALAILRLPLVYGPRAPANFARLVAAVRGRWPLPLAAVDNRRHLLALSNLTEAIARAVVLPQALAGTYFVADDGSISTPALVRAIAASVGVCPRLFALPVPLLRVAGSLTGHRAMIERLVGSLEVDIEPLVAGLGWRPRPFGFAPGDPGEPREGTEAPRGGR